MKLWARSWCLAFFDSQCIPAYTVGICMCDYRRRTQPGTMGTRLPFPLPKILCFRSNHFPGLLRLSLLYWVALGPFLFYSPFIYAFPVADPGIVGTEMIPLLSSLLCPFLPFLPCCSLPRSNPLNPAMGFGGALKSLPSGSGQSPVSKRILSQKSLLIVSISSKLIK